MVRPRPKVHVLLGLNPLTIRHVRSPDLAALDTRDRTAVPSSPQAEPVLFQRRGRTGGEVRGAPPPPPATANANGSPRAADLYEEWKSRQSETDDRTDDDGPLLGTLAHGTQMRWRSRGDGNHTISSVHGSTSGSVYHGQQPTTVSTYTDNGNDNENSAARDITDMGYMEPGTFRNTSLYVDHGTMVRAIINNNDDKDYTATTGTTPHRCTARQSQPPSALSRRSHHHHHHSLHSRMTSHYGVVGRAASVAGSVGAGSIFFGSALLRGPSVAQGSGYDYGMMSDTGDDSFSHFAIDQNNGSVCSDQHRDDAYYSDLLQFDDGGAGSGVALGAPPLSSCEGPHGRPYNSVTRRRPDSAAFSVCNSRGAMSVPVFADMSQSHHGMIEPPQSNDGNDIDNEDGAYNVVTSWIARGGGRQHEPSTTATTVTTVATPASEASAAQKQQQRCLSHSQPILPPVGRGSPTTRPTTTTAPTAGHKGLFDALKRASASPAWAAPSQEFNKAALSRSAPAFSHHDNDTSSGPSAAMPLKDIASPPPRVPPVRLTARESRARVTGGGKGAKDKTERNSPRLTAISGTPALTGNGTTQSPRSTPQPTKQKPSAAAASRSRSRSSKKHPPKASAAKAKRRAGSAMRRTMSAKTSSNKSGGSGGGSNGGSRKGKSASGSSSDGGAGNKESNAAAAYALDMMGSFGSLPNFSVDGGSGAELKPSRPRSNGKRTAAAPPRAATPLSVLASQLTLSHSSSSGSVADTTSSSSGSVDWAEYMPYPSGGGLGIPSGYSYYGARPRR